MTHKTMKELKPKLRFPEFRDKPGWELKRLDQFCDLNPTNKGLPESFYYIDLESVESGRLGNPSRISRSDAPSRAQRLLNRNDIIYQTVRPYQRNNLLCDFVGGDDYVASTGYAQLRASNSHAFLYQLVHTDPFVNKVLAKCTGSNYPAINPTSLATINIAVPLSVAEQTRIAECLSSLDELIAAHGRKLDALKAYKKGLMQNLFPRPNESQPRLRFPEFRDGPEWEKRTLVSTCDMQAGTFVSAAEIYKKQEQDLYPCYGGNGLRGYTKTFTHTGKYSLIGRQGALCGNINLIDGQFHATEHALVVYPKQGIDVDWLYHSLGILNLNQYAIGQAQPGLSVGRLKEIPLHVPTNEGEQQKIAECLSTLDTLIGAYTKNIGSLELHKKGLMQQLFPSPFTLEWGD